jgi:hypothetical protein
VGRIFDFASIEHPAPVCCVRLWVPNHMSIVRGKNIYTESER